MKHAFLGSLSLFILLLGGCVEDAPKRNDTEGTPDAEMMIEVDGGSDAELPVIDMTPMEIDAAPTGCTEDDMCGLSLIHI